MPPLGDIDKYKHVIVDKYPSLENVWFFIDKLKLLLEWPKNGRIQSTFYNGSTHYHCVTNIFSLYSNWSDYSMLNQQCCNIYHFIVAEEEASVKASSVVEVVLAAPAEAGRLLL